MIQFIERGQNLLGVAQEIIAILGQS